MEKDRAIRSFLIGVLAGFCIEYFRSLIQEVCDAKGTGSRDEEQIYFKRNGGIEPWRNRIN